MSEDAYKAIFSVNLKRMMSINDKTQIDIVKDLDFDKSTVSSWVNGTRLPRMDKVQQLADYFGCLRSDLIENKPAAPPTFSPDEKELVSYYRRADGGTKAAVRKLLDIPEEKEGLYVG